MDSYRETVRQWITRPGLVAPMAAIALLGCTDAPELNESSATQTNIESTEVDNQTELEVESSDAANPIDVREMCEGWGKHLAVCDNWEERLGNTKDNENTSELRESDDTLNEEVDFCETIEYESLLCIEESDVKFTLSSLSQQLLSQASTEGDMGATLILEEDLDVTTSLGVSLYDQIIEAAQNQSTEEQLNQELTAPDWVQSVIDDMINADVADNTFDAIGYIEVTDPPQIATPNNVVINDAAPIDPEQARVDLDLDYIANIQDPDVDGDGVENPFDTDIDGDGIANNRDPEPWGDTTHVWASSGNEAFNPALHNDNDGIPDSIDFTPTDANFRDINGNGVTDVFEAIQDGNVRIAATTYTELMVYSAEQAQLRAKAGEVLATIEDGRQRRLRGKVADLMIQMQEGKSERIRTILGMNTDRDGDTVMDWIDGYHGGDDFGDINNNGIRDGDDPYI